ncbi:unnamed protein product, partial [Musa textilis]
GQRSVFPGSELDLSVGGVGRSTLRPAFVQVYFSASSAPRGRSEPSRSRRHRRARTLPRRPRILGPSIAGPRVTVKSC